MERVEKIMESLPGLDCGMCGAKTCEQFAKTVREHPEERKRCIHQDPEKRVREAPKRLMTIGDIRAPRDAEKGSKWRDSLGRDYDFILDTFKGDPGPRETIIPHNPLLTRELGIKKGDILIGRPMGMSCGCPITHCGVAMEVDGKSGIITWCVTGPLQPRSLDYKDLGYYSALAYDGLVRESRAELKIGMRYWFMPRRCMLQWRHSGLINFMSRSGDGMNIRVEGLLIG